MPVRVLSPGQAADVTGVLCAAFGDYPVMRYVLGPAPDYPERLRTLVGFFVAARVLRGDLLLGIRNPAHELVAAALVTLPGDRDPPPSFEDTREAIWRKLGEGARTRYEAYGAATRAFDIGERHHHLNMIGVRPAELGRGYARALLEHVHRVASEDRHSAGVSLTTEVPRNLALYRYFGYREHGHAVVSPELETWGMFRPRDAAPSGDSPTRPTPSG